MIKAAKPFFREEDRSAIAGELKEVIKTGRLIFGPYTARFEKAFASSAGTKYSVALSSCSAALETVLRYIGVEDKEVVVPTNTFVATAFAVLKAGARPVLCNIEEEFYSMSPESLKAKVTKKTKAVIAVHIGGYISPRFDEIKSFCKKKGLILIEDAAHAHGASFKGRAAGSMSLAGCFSFYPTKVMTSGVGGAITTDDNRLYEYAKSMRHFGQGKDLGDIVREGNDWLMDELRAVVAYHQLMALKENLGKRRQIAGWYDKAFEDIKGVSVFSVHREHRPAYYRYLISLDSGIDKDIAVKKLREDFEIEAGTLYDPPVHRQPFFKNDKRIDRKGLEGSDRLLKKQISLPMHPGLSKKDIEFIAKALRSVCR